MLLFLRSRLVIGYCFGSSHRICPCKNPNMMQNRYHYWEFDVVRSFLWIAIPNHTAGRLGFLWKLQTSCCIRLTQKIILDAIKSYLRSRHHKMMKMTHDRKDPLSSGNVAMISTGGAPYLSWLLKLGS